MSKKKPRRIRNIDGSEMATRTTIEDMVKDLVETVGNQTLADIFEAIFPVRDIKYDAETKMFHYDVIQDEIDEAKKISKEIQKEFAQVRLMKSKRQKYFS